MLDLLSDLKICLGLTLLLGLITGYLYNLFSLKEKYKPSIVDMKNSITAHNDEIDHLDKKYTQTQEDLNRYKQNIQEGKNRLKKLDQNIIKEEQEIKNKQNDISTLSQKLESLHTTLSQKQEQKNTLTSQIGSDTPQSLKELHEENKTKLQTLNTEIRKENNILSETQQRYHILQKQRDTLQQEQYQEEKRLRELEEKLHLLKEKESKIESTLQQEIEELKSSQYSLLEKIRAYREELLKISSKY